MGLELLGVQWYGFIQPKKENVRREVYENTKSYVHGKIQDLARYYEEWTKSNPKERAAIESLVRMNLSDFKADNIQNYKLRQFLIKVRGY